MLTVGGAGITVNSGAGPVTISAPITMSAPQSWTNNAANPLTISGPVNNGGNLLAVAGSGTTTLSSAISGMGGLTMQGTGTLILTASQSFSGPTVVSGGVLKLQGALPLPSVNSKLQYDLDASNPASVGVVPGQPVTSWNDMSGNDRNFTNGSVAAPTLVANVFGSLPGVQFDGSTTSLNYSGNVTAQTVFIVCEDGGGPSLGGIWGNYGADNGIRTDTSTAWRGNPGNTNGGDYTNNGTTYITTGPSSFDVNTTSFTAGAPQILVAYGNQTYNNTGLGNYFYGGTGYWSGDIGEVLAYNTQLSTQDRQAIETYLYDKWLGGGGELERPAGHHGADDRDQRDVGPRRRQPDGVLLGRRRQRDQQRFGHRFDFDPQPHRRHNHLQRHDPGRRYAGHDQSGDERQRYAVPDWVCAWAGEFGGQRRHPHPQWQQ